MGWEIHITRAAQWLDSDRAPITPEEWLAYVAADPDMTIDPAGNGPYFALWLAHRIAGEHPWFDWFEGSIGTKYPDPPTLGKALQIARHFRAQVQGDDGEVYEP